MLDTFSSCKPASSNNRLEAFPLLLWYNISMDRVQTKQLNVISFDDILPFLVDEIKYEKIEQYVMQKYFGDPIVTADTVVIVQAKTEEIARGLRSTGFKVYRRI